MKLPRAAVAIATGGRHAGVLLSDGTAMMWGAGGCGQLGLGDVLHATTPVMVETLADATSLSCGEDFTACVARAATGAHSGGDVATVWVWGRCDFTQRRDGGGGAASIGCGVPRPLPCIGGVGPPSAGRRALSCGYYHGSCLLASGGLLSWSAHGPQRVEGPLWLGSGVGSGDGSSRPPFPSSPAPEEGGSVRPLPSGEGSDLRISAVACGGFASAVIASPRPMRAAAVSLGSSAAEAERVAAPRGEARAGVGREEITAAQIAGVAPARAGAPELAARMAAVQGEDADSVADGCPGPPLEWPPSPSQLEAAPSSASTPSGSGADAVATARFAIAHARAEVTAARGAARQIEQAPPPFSSLPPSLTLSSPLSLSPFAHQALTASVTTHARRAAEAEASRDRAAAGEMRAAAAAEAMAAEAAEARAAAAAAEKAAVAAEVAARAEVHAAARKARQEAEAAAKEAAERAAAEAVERARWEESDWRRISAAQHKTPP